MQKRSDFVPTMRSFLTWYFRTLDPAFVSELCAGRTIEEAAQQVLDGIVADVRGNRSDPTLVKPADYGAIMDRIAALHLRTRHGEHVFTQELFPDQTDH